VFCSRQLPVGHTWRRGYRAESRMLSWRGDVNPERGALVELKDEPPHYPQIAQLHYTRLARLHQGLIVGVMLMSWTIIQALMRTTGIHH
jgi:hypothetical protein